MIFFIILDEWPFYIQKIFNTIEAPKVEILSLLDEEKEVKKPLKNYKVVKQFIDDNDDIIIIKSPVNFKKKNEVSSIIDVEDQIDKTNGSIEVIDLLDDDKDGIEILVGKSNTFVMSIDDERKFLNEDGIEIYDLTGDNDDVICLDKKEVVEDKKLVNNFKENVEKKENTRPVVIKKDCDICCFEYDYPSAKYWVELKCKHELCTICRTTIKKEGVAMCGKKYTCIKCPFCMNVDGVEIGTCPDGTIDIKNAPQKLPGYEAYGCIIVTYTAGGTSRVTYFPDSSEGRRVVDLLRIAWDRRLVFRIGTSATTGAQNTVVWNIHHKTSMSGGVQMHGYPDATYLERVTDELKQRGIQ